MFPIRRIDKTKREADEPLGSKPKFWFSEDGKRYLFKADERGTGEDWAEKIVCHLCKLLGLPHVHYELAAEYDGASFVWPGVICETCAPQPPYLILGNQLLFSRDRSYPVGQCQRYKVRHHTIASVADAVGQLHAPDVAWMAGVPSGVETALDVFVGYVMLDALVANQDRHHENWAALSDYILRLAPTFDHGAALARNLTDEQRKERLTTKDRNRRLDAFVRNARSAFYSDVANTKPLGTLEAFLEFASLATETAKIWLARLESIERAEFMGIIGEIPQERMTDQAKEFTLELIANNQRRLVDETAKL